MPVSVVNALVVDVKWLYRVIRFGTILFRSFHSNGVDRIEILWCGKSYISYRKNIRGCLLLSCRYVKICLELKQREIVENGLFYVRRSHFWETSTKYVGINPKYSNYLQIFENFSFLLYFLVKTKGKRFQ